MSEKNWISIQRDSALGKLATLALNLHDAAASVVTAKEGMMDPTDWPIRALKDEVNRFGGQLLNENPIGLQEENGDNLDYYLLCIWGDIEPEVLGPFKSELDRDNRCKQLKGTHGDEHGMFPLSVPEGAPAPTVAAYSGAFFEDV